MHLGARSSLDVDEDEDLTKMMMATTYIMIMFYDAVIIVMVMLLMMLVVRMCRRKLHPGGTTMTMSRLQVALPRFDFVRHPFQFAL